MNDRSDRQVSPRPGGDEVSPDAVRPLTTDAALRLDMPHAVVVLTGGAWRHAWLLGHDRDAEAVSFLVQRLDADGAEEPVWLSDVELGEVDPRHRAASA